MVRAKLYWLGTAGNTTICDLRDVVSPRRQLTKKICIVLVTFLFFAFVFSMPSTLLIGTMKEQILVRRTFPYCTPSRIVDYQ